MAYADSPFGFVPVKYMDGRPYNGAAKPYWVDSSDSTALFIGDPVQIDGTSNTAEVSAVGAGTFAPGTLEGVTRATAGATNIVTGIVVGVCASDRDSLVYRAASTERVVLVADDPDLLFMAQADEAVATTSIGQNSNFVIGSGSTATGVSAAEIDGTVGSDATFQLVIHSAVNDPKNAVNAVGNRFLAQISLHQRRSAGGIVGV